MHLSPAPSSPPHGVLDKTQPSPRVSPRESPGLLSDQHTLTPYSILGAVSDEQCQLTTQDSITTIGTLEGNPDGEQGPDEVRTDFHESDNCLPTSNDVFVSPPGVKATGVAKKCSTNKPMSAGRRQLLEAFSHPEVCNVEGTPVPSEMLTMETPDFADCEIPRGAQSCPVRGMHCFERGSFRPTLEHVPERSPFSASYTPAQLMHLAPRQYVNHKVLVTNLQDAHEAAGVWQAQRPQQPLHMQEVQLHRAHHVPGVQQVQQVQQLHMQMQHLFSQQQVQQQVHQVQQLQAPQQVHQAPYLAQKMHKPQLPQIPVPYGYSFAAPAQRIQQPSSVAFTPSPTRAGHFVISSMSIPPGYHSTPAVSVPRQQTFSLSPLAQASVRPQPPHAQTFCVGASFVAPVCSSGNGKTMGDDTRLEAMRRAVDESKGLRAFPH